jgi:hypothetical protein
LGERFDGLIDRAAEQLDAVRHRARNARGEARRRIIEELGILDAEIRRTARESMAPALLAELDREADAELMTFRERMSPEAYTRARAAAVDRLLRERLGLPAIAFSE